MLHRINLREKWLNILLILLSSLFVIFANVSAEIPRPAANTITLNAIIYLPTATLKPIFQSQIDQQLQSGPGSLIHPSVTQLTPQSDGLAMTLSQSFLPIGPPPIDSTTLLTFSVPDSSTIQVSAQPTPGSLLTLDGPLTQIKVTQGHVNSISPTPNCGDSALAVKLGFPISIGQGQQAPQAKVVQSTEMIQQPSTDAANAYVEITSSALSALGNQLGSFPVSQNLTAQNIRIGIQDNEIVVRSDISLWQTGIVVGSSTTHILPLVENGNLLLHVTKTDVAVQFFTFPDDSYDQQIQDQISQQLAGTLGGLFTVSKAAIGTDTHIPCTASDSLILTGTTNMLS
ncbi:MAG TPA: hypothetical protein VGL94_07185 [Ktedonobacteraceae bacterium]|jgi:hypothetical protein